MKRHPYLQPLSREHHLGLVLANHARHCQDPNEIRTHWQAITAYLDQQMQQHFAIEDGLIVQFVTDSGDSDAMALIAQMQEEHRDMDKLRHTTDPSLTDLHALADALTAHIRYEEQQVYPVIERILDDVQLLAIYHASHPDVK